MAASYQGEWFRAQIVALQAGHVKVKYVDYGNSEIIASDQIRTLSQEFKEVPAQSVRLSIYGIMPVTDKSWSKLVYIYIILFCNIISYSYSDNYVSHLQQQASAD